jgi:hypothetical protein
VPIVGETDGAPVSRACSIKINKFTKALKSTKEGSSEVIETPRLGEMTIWGETDGLPLSRDRLLKIGKIARSLKPTKQ